VLPAVGTAEPVTDMALGGSRRVGVRKSRHYIDAAWFFLGSPRRHRDLLNPLTIGH
jgi:hypothetical protein